MEYMPTSEGATPTDTVVGELSRQDEDEKLHNAFRKAYTDQDKLKQGLGVSRDAIATAQVGVTTGFYVAERSTRFGFGIARGILGGLGKTRVPILSQVCHGVDGVVGVAHQITDFSQKSAKFITQTSLTVVDKGLELGGGEKYEGVKLVFGAEETDAMIAIADAAAHFPKLVASGTERFNMLGFISGLIVLKRLQRAKDAERLAEVSEGSDDQTRRNAILADRFPVYRRYLWLCAAMYGKLFNHAMGTFWQIGGDQTDEKNFIEFVATRAFRYETVYLRDEKGIRGSRLRRSNRSSGSLPINVKDNITMYRPAHGVFVDRTNKEVVVAIRGTASIRDALTDLVCQPEELSQEDRERYELDVYSDLTHVHPGMWKAAKRLDQDLSPYITDLLNTEKVERIVVTGHSLGAGTATLLSLIWSLKSGFREKSKLACFAFGTPQTMNEDAARIMGAIHARNEIHPLITSFIVGNDLVSRLSLRSALQLAERGMRLGNSRSSETTTIALNDYSSSVDHIPALSPPGKIVYMRAPGRVHALNEPVEADQAEFSSIRVSRDMLIDHLWMKAMTVMGANEAVDFNASD